MENTVDKVIITVVEKIPSVLSQRYVPIFRRIISMFWIFRRRSCPDFLT